MALKDSTLQMLVALKIPVTRIVPATGLTDAAIELGGEYDGIHITIGFGYYSVVRAMPDGTYYFVTGNGFLPIELQLARDA